MRNINGQGRNLAMDEAIKIENIILPSIQELK
jgi:hypothetical protein